MTRSKRPNGAGRIYIKHGSYYGRRSTSGGGRTNRKLGWCAGRAAPKG